MKCSKCGFELVDGANFCSSCGEKVQKEKKCSNCGVVVDAAARFCFVCGTKLDANPASGESGSPSYESDLAWYGNFFTYVGKPFDGKVFVKGDEAWNCGYVPLPVPEFEKSQADAHIGSKNAGVLSSIRSMFLHRVEVNGKINNEVIGNENIEYWNDLGNGDSLIITNDKIYKIISGRTIEMIGYPGNIKGSVMIWTSCRVQQQRGDAMGLMNIETGAELLENAYTDIEFEDIWSYNNATNNYETVSGRFVVIAGRYMGGKILYGCLNSKLEWILPAQYASLSRICDVSDYWTSGLLTAVKNEGDGIAVFDALSGKEIVIYNSDSVECKIAGENCPKAVYCLSRDEKRADIICEGRICYSYYGAVAVGTVEGASLLTVENQLGQMELVSVTGEVRIPFGTYDRIGSYMSEGGIKVHRNNLCGFVDEYGNILIPAMYADIFNSYQRDEEPGILVRTADGVSMYINYKNQQIKL